MRIALVHDFLTQFGGGERVLQAFTEIWPDAPIYLIAYDQKVAEEHFPNSKINTSFLQKFPGMPKRFKYYLPFMPRAIESFDFTNFDLVISDSSAYAKGAITKAPTKHICYLHTPTRYLTSDRETYIKSAPIPLPLIGRPIVKMITKMLQGWDLRSAQRADVMITNSENIKKRTEKYYHRTADYVLLPPVDGSKFHIAPKIGDYWLIVARNEPYKRTDIAIEAATKLGLKLKVAGGGTKIGELQKIAGPTVEFLGRVSDEELAKLYSEAVGFIFPPNEDAGITPLEAMASGRPVVAYGEGGALETVVAGVTGEFFTPQTTEALIEVLKNYNPERYNPQKIREHALKFDKEIFKKKIKEIVEKTLSA